ncbi:hypothetical protein RLEG3_02795 (plasmid) [Rhizobium leguminosarum bv. trifolii WSM1689]|nr:hypothetical protein RLEG3_02795 [Rhizobium leguminosarum bv. trifolii WSM1689]
MVAEKLHRHRPTILRELRRNTFEGREMPDLNGYYCMIPMTWRENGVPSWANMTDSRSCANR